MAKALDEFRIEGINHNIAFLTAIMHNPRFREGRLTTGFIAEEFPEGFHGLAMDEASARRFTAAAIAVKLVRTWRAGKITGAMNGAHVPGRDFVVALDDRRFEIADATIEAGKLFLRIDGEPFQAVTDWKPGDPTLFLRQKNGEHAIHVKCVQGGYRLEQGGIRVTASARSLHAAELARLMPKKLPPDTSKFLLCPMPGLVVSVNVHEGQDVKAGETLAVVEAMKMENVLTAERDGTVSKVNAKKGDSLALDEVILEFA